MLKTITSTYQLPNNLSISLDRTDLYITGCSPRTKTLTWNRVQLTKRKRNVLFLMQATQNFQHNSLWTVYERIQQHTDPIESEILDNSLYFILKKCRKRNLSEMTSYLSHIAQHTGLSKRKFEIQIPYYWLICQHCLVFTKCSTQHRVPLGKYFFGTEQLS